MPKDKDSGKISGAIRWEDLDEDWRIKTIEARELRFQITARNVAGKAKVVVRMLLLRAPHGLEMRHSQVTYEVGKSRIAFSKELIDEAAANGWHPLPFGPIDIKRTEDTNGPATDFFAGSTFIWPERSMENTPCIAGQAVDIKGRWPLFHISPDLPHGLSLNVINGTIEGAPIEEVEGDWAVTVSNPAGNSQVMLHLRVMAPPSDFIYDYVEAVLIRGRDIGENTCQVTGTWPMRFAAEALPRGLEVDDKSGTITGIPDQLDQDFVTYRLLVANDVGQASCKIKLLLSTPPPDGGKQDSGISIINKDVEARVGQRVAARPNYIAKQRRLGLEDVSATNARNRQDMLRSGKLQLQSWEIAGQPRGAHAPDRSPQNEKDACIAEAGALHETAAGRGTIINVFDGGNSCQVRWDATGLVSIYDTGRHGIFTLQTWGSDTQLRKHWEALPQHIRETLHDDVHWLLDEFLDEFNALTPLQHTGFHKTTKAKLAGPAHKHSMSGNVDDICPRGSGIMQRLIHELDTGWLERYKVFKDASLWMAIQIPDRKVGMKVDWDPYIAFMEFLQRRSLFQKGVSHPPEFSDEAAGWRHEAEDLAAAKVNNSRSHTRPRTAHLGGLVTSTADEKLCAEAWLFIDHKMRLALQDNFEHRDMAAAVLQHCRQHTRRLDLRKFQAGARDMSRGLNLRLSEQQITDLFTQADADKDGYITFLDALRALRSKPAGQWEKLKRLEWSRNGSLPVDVQRFNKVLNKGILSITWKQLAHQVQTRSCSLTFGAFAGDIHHVVDNRIKAPFPVFELRSRRVALGQVRSSRQWAA